MKPVSPLAAVYAKTKWAKTEIDKLQADIGEFVAAKPYEIVTNVNVQTNEKLWRFKVTRDLPADVEIRIGNILQNLREPLDNVLAILSDRKRGRADKVGFPFEWDMDNYGTALAKVVKLLPDGAEDLIRSAHTYPGGNAHLRALHFLNRDKKHRLPIAPFNMKTGFLMQVFAAWGGGLVYRVGFKNGQHLIPTFPDGNMLPINNPTFIPNRGFVFEPGPGDDDMEFAVTSPQEEIYAAFEPTLDVSFTEPASLKREPVCIALHQMRELVDGVLLTFERRFFP